MDPFALIGIGIQAATTLGATLGGAAINADAAKYAANAAKSADITLALAQEHVALVQAQAAQQQANVAAQQQTAQTSTVVKGLAVVAIVLLLLKSSRSKP